MKSLGERCYARFEEERMLNQGKLTKLQVVAIIDDEAKKFKRLSSAEFNPIAEQIFLAYPKRVAKIDALKAISAVLEKGIDADSLLKKVAKYSYAVRKNKTENQFIPLCASWMRAGRYEDDETEWGIHGGENIVPGQQYQIDERPKQSHQTYSEPNKWREWVTENTDFELGSKSWNDLEQYQKKYISEQINKTHHVIEDQD